METIVQNDCSPQDCFISDCKNASLAVSHINVRSNCIYGWRNFDICIFKVCFKDEQDVKAIVEILDKDKYRNFRVASKHGTHVFVIYDETLVPEISIYSNK